MKVFHKRTCVHWLWVLCKYNRDDRLWWCIVHWKEIEWWWCVCAHTGTQYCQWPTSSLLQLFNFNLSRFSGKNENHIFTMCQIVTRVERIKCNLATHSLLPDTCNNSIILPTKRMIKARHSKWPHNNLSLLIMHTSCTHFHTHLTMTFSSTSPSLIFPSILCA